MAELDQGKMERSAFNCQQRQVGQVKRNQAKTFGLRDVLTDNPEYIESTVLIQICIGSAQDPDYELEIMKIVSRINSMPENISVTQPVVLLQRDIGFDQYLALLCEADVFVVSSMREGLNLTCHEFITATEDKKSP